MSKPGKSLKGLCKKLGVRLTVKRGQKRVYKNVAVLKRQCKNKVKRKKVIKRRRRFGTSSETNEPPDSELVSSIMMIYFGSVVVRPTPRDIINRMRDMITPHFERDPELDDRDINYLIHNNFFKSRSLREGSMQPDEMLSEFMMGYYHKFVPFKRSNMTSNIRSKALDAWDGPPEQPLSTRDMVTKFAIHAATQDFQVGYGNNSIVGKYTMSACRRKGINYHTENPNLDADVIFYKLHQHTLRGFRELVRILRSVRREHQTIVSSGRRLHIPSFINRIGKELCFLLHKIRMSCLPDVDKLTIIKDDGRLSHHFCHRNLRLCSCEDFYYRRFSNNRASRTCKHIRREFRENERVYLTPDRLPGEDNITPIEQFYFNIVRLERSGLIEMSMDSSSLTGTRLYGLPGVIDPDYGRRLALGRDINNPNSAIQVLSFADDSLDAPPYSPYAPPEDDSSEGPEYPYDIEELKKEIIRTNVKLSKPDDTCYLCLEPNKYLINNCPRTCNSSLICIHCVKSYPDNWIVIPNYNKCGTCRAPLTTDKKRDINTIKYQIEVDEFNSLSRKIFAKEILERVAPGLANVPGVRVYFGKKKKKASVPESLKKVCKRLKIRLTVKRKGKRVYKSVKVLKELCKKALKKKVLRKSKVVKKKRRKVVKKKKKVVKKRKKVVKKRKKVVRKRKFGRNPTPSITKAPVRYNPSKLYRHQIPSQKSLKMISGEPKGNQQYKSYKGSSSTYGF